jgi:hypothetical protein
MIEIFFSAAYVLFIVNFIASSGTEALASTFKWRSQILFKGVKALLNDNVTQLATRIYADALVHPRSSGDTQSTSFEKTLPSYIDPQAFANAIIAALSLDQQKINLLYPPDQSADFNTVLENVKSNIPDLRGDEQLSQLLAGAIYRHKGDFEAIRAAIANWFEQSAERIGGSYKRRAQLSNFLIALVMAVIFNVNPLPPSVAALTQVKVPPDDGTALAVAGGVNVVTPPATSPGSKGSPPSANANHANGGNGQSPASTGMNAAREAGTRIFGWLITALSTLLGAPFWFNALSLVSAVKKSSSKSDSTKEQSSAPAAVAIATQPSQPPSGQASS